MTEAVPRPPIRHDRRGAAETGPVRKRIIDYPRAGKQGFWRWIPSWKLILGTVLFGIASVIILIGVAYARTAVPEIAPITEAQTTIVYYDDGHTELGRFQVQNRVILTDDKIPAHLKDAVVAAEDRTFWTNKGISPRGIARAAWNNFHGGSLQGGSTLTQQYVKNVLLNTQDRTYKRKAKEFFIAVKVANDNELGKTKILDSYLNTIYFGRNSYGVEAAAQSYFRKPAAKLDVSQSAFLAGIINGPEFYDPEDGEESAAAAKARWNYVLDSMVAIGKLTPQERATQEFPKVYPVKTRNNMGGQRGYLLTMVRNELRQRVGLNDDQIDRSGLRITTTFNQKMVKAAADTVDEVLPKDTPKGVHVAVSTIDPATGAVKAIYGGKDFLKRNRNAATQDIAQAGSTFKPFALAAALNLKEPIGLKTRFDGHSPQEFKGFENPVFNFSNEQEGYIDLVRATQHSVNTVYVALNELVEARNTMKAAIDAGIPKTAKDLNPNPANVLGTASVNPIDMATAYATFAAQGVHHDRFVIQKITGPIKWDVKSKGLLEGERVFSKDSMADVTYALQAVVDGGTGSYARGLGRPVAGKTGTSSSNKSAWFVGYTPQLATSVALYREGKSKSGAPTQERLGSWGGYREITGGSFPVIIWTEYMKKAVDGMKVEEFPEPAWIGGRSGPTSTVTASTETEKSDRPTKSPDDDKPSPTSTPTPTATAKPTKTQEPTPTRTEQSPSPSGGDDDDDPPTSPSPSP